MNARRTFFRSILGIGSAAVSQAETKPEPKPVSIKKTVGDVSIEYSARTVDECIELQRKSAKPYAVGERGPEIHNVHINGNISSTETAKQIAEYLRRSSPKYTPFNK